MRLNIGAGLSQSILGGPSTLTESIAAALGDRVRLNTTVDEIVQKRDSAVVRCREVRCTWREFRWLPAEAGDSPHAVNGLANLFPHGTAWTRRRASRRRRWAPNGRVWSTRSLLSPAATARSRAGAG
ncbi:hypothetical protein [Streptomyces sp. SD31]|uniref:hypothetical protein n=1 Tax=Streptomyces sp. SD31 TaxID=3452208 RepID=UPI003F8AF700